MPLLDAALERMHESSTSHANEDLAAVYELGLSAPSRLAV